MPDNNGWSDPGNPGEEGGLGAGWGGSTTEEDYAAGNVPANWGGYDWGGYAWDYPAWTPEGQYELGSKTPQEWALEQEARAGVLAYQKGPPPIGGAKASPFAREDIPPEGWKSTEEAAAYFASKGAVVLDVPKTTDVLGGKGATMTVALKDETGKWTPYDIPLSNALFARDYKTEQVPQFDKGVFIGYITQQTLVPETAHLFPGSMQPQARPGEEGFMGDWKKPPQINYAMTTGKWGEPRPIVASYEPGVQPEPSGPTKDWREQLIRNYSEDEWNAISTSDKASIFNYVETVMRMNRSVWLARMMAGWSHRRPTAGTVRPTRR